MEYRERQKIFFFKQLVKEFYLKSRILGLQFRNRIKYFNYVPGQQYLAVNVKMLEKLAQNFMSVNFSQPNKFLFFKTLLKNSGIKFYDALI